jgi:hypothetical protein
MQNRSVEARILARPRYSRLRNPIAARLVIVVWPEMTITGRLDPGGRELGGQRVLLVPAVPEKPLVTDDNGHRVAAPGVITAQADSGQVRGEVPAGPGV